MSRVPVCLLLLSFLGCRPSEAPGVRVRDGFARFSPGTGAAYFVIENTTAVDDRLVRVSSPVAKIVELHETILEEGLAVMEPRPGGFVVPAGERVDLVPGGRHVMLFHVRDPAPASEVELTLHFEHTGAVAARLPVRARGE